MSGAEQANDEIRFARRGAVGLVTRHRPRALDARSLGMIGALHAQRDAWAAEDGITRSAIRTRCPTSLCIAREQMRRGPDLDFGGAVLTEYRRATRLMRGHDLFEGVRAVLIDKDGRPDWRPATLEAVDHAAVAAAFGPADGPEPRS